jgi:pyruvate/2-oxoglutarate dehydrogenase complex dihydrolipoamide acyltransferase (E2) component
MNTYTSTRAPLLPPPGCTADGNGITYNEHVNVALAVAMPDGGLITPVLKDADKTDIYQVSAQGQGG